MRLTTGWLFERDIETEGQDAQQPTTRHFVLRDPEAEERYQQYLGEPRTQSENDRDITNPVSESRWEEELARLALDDGTGRYNNRLVVPPEIVER